MPEKNHLKSWVILLPDDISEPSNPVIIKLKHPRTGEASMYLTTNEIIYEVMSFSEKKASWFINNSVKEDGTLFITTKIDPLFLVLPYLIKSKTQPIEDILVDNEFFETCRLVNLKYDLNLIADKKGNEDLCAWAYNQNKTLNWLKKKVNQVINYLQGDVKIENVPLYAFGLISEYIPEELSNKLRIELNLPEETTQNKRKSSKTDLNETTTKKVKKEKDNAKEKKNLKAAVGSKTITSFFKKK